MQSLCRQLIPLLFDDVQNVSKNLKPKSNKYNNNKKEAFLNVLLTVPKDTDNPLKMGHFYLPGVLRQNDAIIPHPAGGEES